MCFGAVIRAWVFGLFVLTSVWVEASDSTKRVNLSEEQKQWLREHSPILVGITPEWGPFSYFTKDGTPSGVDVDVLNRIAEHTGVKFEIIPATPWERMWRMVQEGKLDMTTSTVQTPERDKVLRFTRPYGESSTVIVAKEGDHRFSHLLQLRNATVAQPSNHLLTLKLKERLPQASMVLLGTQKECFEQVLNGKADATVADMFTAAEYLNEHPEAKLGMSGAIPEFKFSLRLAVRRQYSPLVDILDAGLATMSQDELDEIVARHLSFDLQSSRRAHLLQKRILWVFGIGFAIAAGFYFWNRVLRKQIKARQVVETELRESNRSLEVFAHALSHDLKTPLRAIRGFSEAIQEDYSAKLDDLGRDYLGRVISSVERMECLIGNVLAYSQASRAEFPLESVALEPLLHQLVDELPAQQREYCHVTSKLPEVRANTGLLGQCIANLLSNAFKFIPKERAPNIRIWSERIGATVKLFVEDNGIGIAPGDRERIFQLFARVSPPGYGGSGIGLAVVAKGASRMGGDVGVESEPGEGSRFWINLKAAEENITSGPRFASSPNAKA
jgi:signal transduction histidine kinase